MTEDNLENLIEETQNKEYEGYYFTVNSTSYRSRLAKLTPKKKGYFVAFWEKDSDNNNQAYDIPKSPDNTMIVVEDEDKKGIFIFPKEELLKQKILKSQTQKSKMAIRVYPSWETELNPTATKTQKWQAQYFVDLSN